MKIVKFTHDHSLLYDETRFWVVGKNASPADWYDIRDHDTFVDAVDLDEGLVHFLLGSGGVYEVRSDNAAFFTIQKVRA